MPDRHKTDFIYLGLVAVIGFFVYFNSLGGDFIWDDYDLVKDNAYIKDWSNVKTIFTSDIAAGGARKYYFYRPLQILTYKIDYSLWGLNVRGYHLTNILLHVLVALSVYWLGALLFKNKILSLLTSALFVAHPVNTEAVSYISGRADPLAALFILLCLIFYIKQNERPSSVNYVVMMLSYAAAILSKESSLILPVLLLLYHYAFRKKIKTRLFLPIMCVSFVYVILRLTLLKSLVSYQLSNTTFIQRVPGFFVAVTNYLSVMLLPFNLHMEYGNKIFHFAEPEALIGMCATLFLLSFAFLIKRRYKNDLIFFSIFWFFLGLMPVSNIYPIIAYMAEHWLYLPSIGIFLISAGGLSYLYDHKRFKLAAVILAVCVISFYSYLTIKQNSYWGKPAGFYERTLRYAPDSTRTLNALGNIYVDKGKVKEAVSMYRKAIEIDPSDGATYINLGNAYKASGGEEQAAALYRTAIDVDPRNVRAYNNLGIFYNETGKSDQAISCYKKAIEINPEFSETYANLGFVYYGIGEYDRAISCYKKATGLNPDYAKAHNNLGLVYYKMGKNQEAISSYEEAIKIDPLYAKAYNNLAIVYDDMGNKRKAISLYKKAVETDPKYANAYFNLSACYFNAKEYKLAAEYYNKAVGLGYRADPKFLELLKSVQNK